jgi:hypothetical protein
VGATVPAAGGPPVERGYLRVVVNPWARIKVDGAERGVTPIASPLGLPVGRHTVTIENDFFAPVSRSIDVVAGTTEAPLELVVDLSREQPEAARAGAPPPPEPEPEPESIAPDPADVAPAPRGAR